MTKEILFLILLVGGYLIGSLSPAVFLSKKVAGIDIREKGSKNAGSTNVFRVMGAKWGLLNFLFDCLKGFLPALIGLLIAREVGDGYNGYLGAVIAGGGVLIGHALPIFSHFKGGKCVASTTGILFLLSPLLTLVIFAAAIITITITHYVSLASVSAFILAPICVWIFSYPLPVKVFVTLAAVLILFLHRANIKRLIKGEENKLDFSKKKK